MLLLGAPRSSKAAARNLRGSRSLKRVDVDVTPAVRGLHYGPAPLAAGTLKLWIQAGGMTVTLAVLLLQGGPLRLQYSRLLLL